MEGVIPVYVSYVHHQSYGDVHSLTPLVIGMQKERGLRLAMAYCQNAVFDRCINNIVLTCKYKSFNFRFKTV